ncbi:MAG: ester cyclase [Armatimonadetes bacterium]|nr:ester cyclase [Armatimonadota bacterium]
MATRFVPEEPEENKSMDNAKEMVRRMVEEVWNRGEMTAVDELITPDYIEHNPGFPEGIKGPDDYRRFVAEIRAAFPDFVLSIEDLIAEGDKVVNHWIISGTQKGEFSGIAPTHLRATVPGVTIYRVSEGKFADGWTYWDRLMERFG